MPLVTEDQVSVIEFDCPASAWFGNARVSDGDGVSGRIAEVIDDGAKAFVTAAGIHPYPFTHREVGVVQHSGNLPHRKLWTPNNPSGLLANENENVEDWAASDLAWELADAISPLLAERDREQLYATIGSGDSYAAIVTMLQTMARQSSPISPEITAKLINWLDAYTYSEDANRLHELLRTIRSLR